MEVTISLEMKTRPRPAPVFKHAGSDASAANVMFGDVQIFSERYCSRGTQDIMQITDVIQVTEGRQKPAWFHIAVRLNNGGFEGRIALDR